ncbi:hypothetical protein SAMN05421753_117104 [Planctomicrobium piriforme]|uniref:Uncharacterized protein n=1 Tax=Planctomicrobium piriforme TaxID=1576369 RepID=A0A1I3Q2P1_9PLAN|nr:hypothetical protein SAMN05421753_117104 [Planctomicrobium piriforme]
MVASTLLNIFGNGMSRPIGVENHAHATDVSVKVRVTLPSGIPGRTDQSRLIGIICSFARIFQLGAKQALSDLLEFSDIGA